MQNLVIYINFAFYFLLILVKSYLSILQWQISVHFGHSLPSLCHVPNDISYIHNKVRQFSYVKQHKRQGFSSSKCGYTTLAILMWLMLDPYVMKVCDVLQKPWKGTNHEALAGHLDMSLLYCVSLKQTAMHLSN